MLRVRASLERACLRDAFFIEILFVRIEPKLKYVYFSKRPCGLHYLDSAERWGDAQIIGIIERNGARDLA
jgi:hypothetical protein